MKILISAYNAAINALKGGQTMKAVIAELLAVERAEKSEYSCENNARKTKRGIEEYCVERIRQLTGGKSKEAIAMAREEADLVNLPIDALIRVRLYPESVINSEEAHAQAVLMNSHIGLLPAAKVIDLFNRYLPLKAHQICKEIGADVIANLYAEALTEEATKPKPFTHSFFGHDPAEVVPAHTMIADAVIVKDRLSHGGAETPEYQAAKKDGFVFANWLNVGSHTVLLIKPAGVIRRYMRECIGNGYRIEAFQMNIRRGDATHARACLTARECGGICFSIDAVAGDIELADLSDRLIELLAHKPNGAANCEAIRKLTNQTK